MEHIKKQLGINLNKKGLQKTAEASFVCYLFEKVKNDILGSNILCQAISFQNGILKIQAPDPVTASEIRFRREAIKKEINEKIGSNIIQRVDAKS